MNRPPNGDVIFLDEYLSTGDDQPDSQPESAAYLASLCCQSDEDDPDEIIQRIHRHFRKKGREYQRGLISETEFYNQTGFTPPLIDDLVGRKYDIRIHSWHLNKDNALRNAFDEWKATGNVAIGNWFVDAVSGVGNPVEIARWLFTVIDALKVPMELFTAIDYPDSAVWPDQMSFLKGTTIKTFLSEKCDDPESLLSDKDPVGKEFVLHCGGILVHIMIRLVRENYYSGTGIIEGYMAAPGHLSIEKLDDTGMRVVFNTRTNIPYYMTPFAQFAPLPHPNWNKYNVAMMTRQLQAVTAFKILRLPYMVTISDTRRLIDLPENS